MKKRDYDGAITAFGKAYDADPDNVGYLNSRGIAHERKGEDDLALADCNDVLAQSPRSVYTLTSRGNLYLAKGDLDAAPPILRDAASRLLRMRMACCDSVSYTTTLSRFAARVMPV
jgi:Flp pilus assembly protein TadD